MKKNTLIFNIKTSKHYLRNMQLNTILNIKLSNIFKYSITVNIKHMKHYTSLTKTLKNW